MTTQIGSPTIDSVLGDKIADKVSRVLSAIKKFGEVNLFAINLDIDRSTWDVLVAGDWLDLNAAEGIRKISKEMSRILTQSEMKLFARIAVLPVNSPVVQSFNSGIAAENTRALLHNCSANGVSFETVILFESKRPTVSLLPALKSSRKNTTGQQKKLASARRKLQDVKRKAHR